ncbi:unnamed protein product [Cunninghamella echinulata]
METHIYCKKDSSNEQICFYHDYSNKRSGKWVEVEITNKTLIEELKGPSNSVKKIRKSKYFKESELPHIQIISNNDEK